MPERVNECGHGHIIDGVDFHSLIENGEDEIGFVGRDGLMQGLQVQADGKGVELLRVELIIEELPRGYVIGYFFIVGDGFQFVVDVEPFVDARGMLIDGHLSTHKFER